MQEYRQSRSRSAEGSVGGVPAWLLEEQGYATPTPSGGNRSRKSDNERSSGGGSNHISDDHEGVRGSPDTRRKHYRGARQQQRDQRYTTTTESNNYEGQLPGLPTVNGIPLELRNRPQHQMIDSMQRMRESEPVYMDIDPNIPPNTSTGMAMAHMQMAHLQRTTKASASSPSRALQQYHQQSPVFVGTPSTAATSYTTNNSAGGASTSRSPARINSRNSSTGSPSSSRGSNASGISPARSSNRSTPSPTNPNNYVARNMPTVSPARTTVTTTVTTSQSTKYPYVHPYVSNGDYRGQGARYHNQSDPRAVAAMIHTTHINNNKHSARKSLYDERPIGPRDQEEQHHGDQLIMFGDDYDLGSINTGMSQQELLQKRRDVKKRREGKYGKKKKSKERIINMPPRLLSMGSWDTSPITKLTSKDNSHHAFYKDGKEQKKWNVLRAFPSQDEGSTDASTRESGDDPAHHRPPNEQPHHHDNSSLNSFPLLSTNAKEGLDPVANRNVESPRDAAVLYAQPGNIPQLQVDHLYEREQRKLHEHQQIQQSYQPTTIQQLRDRSNQDQQHMEAHHRQHGEELEQLESHLRYLQDQHQLLEQEVQERHVNAQAARDAHPRPRVRFSATLTQDLEEKHYEISSKDSPTSVTDLGHYTEYHHQHQDTSNSSSSVLAPKTLFPGKPVSILRRKRKEALDSTGRYPGASSRGRSHQQPVFSDSDGRELSPIRSPAGMRGQTLAAHHYHPDDVSSLPENLEEKDVAVVFDPDQEIDDLELMRREFDEESSLISEAFIEAVAAIVLQTAMRRFIAICRAQRLRMEMGRPTKHKRGLNQSHSTSSSEMNSRQTGVSTLTTSNQTQSSQEDLFYDLAAIQIQSVFRGWWVRDSINVDHYCSTLIQKAFRGFRDRISFDYDVYRVILVQSIWRRNIAIRKTYRHFSLIIKLQAICRGILVRKAVSGMLTLSRRGKARRNSSRKSNERRRSSDKPSHTRASYEKAKAQKKPPPYLNRAQTRPFGPSCMEEARIWHVGAIIIQTYWRSYVGRICYFQSLADVVLVQSVIRRWLTRRRFAGAIRQRGAYQSWPTRNQPQQVQSKPSSGSAVSSRFVKFESFDSRNVSSLGADESVPFRNMSEEDADQFPSPIPTRLPNQPHQHQSQQHRQVEMDGYDSSQHYGRGYFEDASRFGGRNVWSKSGGPPTNEADFGDRYSPCHGQEGASKPDGPITYGAMIKDRQSGSPQAPSQVPIQQQRSPVSRSKGWNAEEDIDKESTRNLLQAWKKKDKANSFTIRPRSGR
ncbi:myosin, heavy chain [Seminavis robusta]|uniref:Myosin, heavy chain n=1 Tax=Seminavis robusta TaxID=568900 RepID=A0A9N8HVV1_9STRA|nr:myosin, heavy chain [Seminavis robusta]|eukprot:Sro2427_g327350.1 myosin, heavy chain (1280) ;mRNA; f:6270-10374